MNYKESKIYALRSPHTDKWYLGSTIQSLSKRKYDHIKNHIRGNQKLTSYCVIEAGDCYIEILEEYPCESKKDLFKREGELIRLHKDKLVNKKVEGRTNKQYYDEVQRDAQKLYYQEHKEHYNQLQNKRREKQEPIVCMCGGRYFPSNLSNHLKTKKHCLNLT